MPDALSAELARAAAPDGTTCERKEEVTMATTMIRCGDHKRAPATLVCIHLAKGLSRRWHAVMVDGSEIPERWVCPECEPHPWDLQLADWELWCMHCIRRVQKATRAKVTVRDARSPQGQEQ
jgi:hypothetical protein